MAVPTAVNISDGKVFQGCNNYGPTWMLTFDSDGKGFSIFRVAYELKLNGEVKRGALRILILILYRVRPPQESTIGIPAAAPPIPRTPV